MKIYNFFDSNYDSYTPVILLHNSDISQEVFEGHCKIALRELAKDYIKNEESWIGFPDWKDFAVEYMMKNFGYYSPDEVSFGHFGSVIIDYDCELGENDLELQEIVGEDIMKLAIEKNKELHNKLWPERKVE